MNPCAKVWYSLSVMATRDGVDTEFEDTQVLIRLVTGLHFGWAWRSA